MAIRFTETDKWDDVWFSGLKPLSKLLFLYLCDQCDIAGFLEINTKKICFDLGIGKQEVERSLNEVETRLIYSTDGRFVFVKNFLRHQRNENLNPANNAHKGIIKRLNDNLLLFDFEDINDFFTSPSLGASEGLVRGTSKGKGNSKVIEVSIDTNSSVESCVASPPDATHDQKPNITAAKAATLHRKKEFYQLLVPFVGKYEKGMIRDFYDYWSELNRSGTKMRFELQSTWELPKRLTTWANKEPIYAKQTEKIQQSAGPAIVD